MAATITRLIKINYKTQKWFHMKNKTSILALVLLIISSFSCEKERADSNSKKIWANSFIDKKAPEFIVEKWLSDEPTIDNKYLLIDFWATWCGPCRKAIPELNSFHKEFKDKLVVIGISAESEERIQQTEIPNIEYYNAIDSQERMYNSLGVTAIPHCIIINPDGVVIWEGFPLLEGNELTAKVIRELINKE